MVDRDLILRKLAELDTYVDQLSEYRELSAASYRESWKTQRIVDRTLQMAIETCADITGRIIADRRLRIPSTYAETFQVLGEAGLLPADLLGALVSMARFRNVLVHGYTRLDPDRVVGILRDHLGDLRHFREAVLASI